MGNNPERDRLRSEFPEDMRSVENIIKSLEIVKRTNFGGHDHDYDVINIAIDRLRQLQDNQGSDKFTQEH